ncbi:MAG: hypothetical protein ACHQKZ_12600 [Solirubrobacterales bacterium]|jgi:hypothetical protein
MSDRRSLATLTVLFAALACLTLPAGPAYAQDPRSEVDCGPTRVNPGDFVAINVGNPGRGPQAPAVLLVRVLDAQGDPLLEQSITLNPGQSRSVRWPRQGGVPGARQTLVRGEVVVQSGPTDLRLVGTLQIFKPDLGYGVTHTCPQSADIGRPGPS